jgi:hypothetical protein
MTPSPSNKKAADFVKGKQHWGAIGNKILQQNAKGDKEDIMDSKMILS